MWLTGLFLCVGLLERAHLAYSISFSFTSSANGFFKSESHLWAVGIPLLHVNLTVSDVSVVGLTRLNIAYKIESTVTASCFALVRDSSCVMTSSCADQSGILFSCSKSGSGSPLVAGITIPDVDSQKNSSIVEFSHTASTTEILDWSNQVFTLLLDNCNTDGLEGAAVVDSNPCGYNCTKTFTCSQPGYAGNDFERTCNAEREWSSSSSCFRACNNSVFANAQPANPDLVGEGTQKVFNCTCAQPTAQFNRTCGANGVWSNTTSPCGSDCGGGLAVGAIIGIVICVLLLVGVVVWLILYRKCHVPCCCCVVKDDEWHGWCCCKGNIVWCHIYKKKRPPPNNSGPEDSRNARVNPDPSGEPREAELELNPKNNVENPGV